MKRRTVLGGAASLAGASLAGCLSGSGNDDDEEEGRADWLREIQVDVKENGRTGSVVAVLSKDSGVSEVTVYKPSGNIQTSTVVGNDQRKVGLMQVSVSTMPVSFYGVDPGTYEIQAQQNQGESERLPFDLVRQFSVEDVSLEFGSSDGTEWVSGFQSTASNDGLYPYLLQGFGPTEGVPNPPEDGPGSATPVDESANAIVWWKDATAFVEDRGEAPGPLVVPEEAGTPDQSLVDELSGEHTATLAYETTVETHTVEVTFRLEGDLVTTPNGYAMSGGEVLSVEGAAVGTATGTEDA